MKSYRKRNFEHKKGIFGHEKRHVGHENEWNPIEKGIFQKKSYRKGNFSG
jgi:hypothetical protein